MTTPTEALAALDRLDDFIARVNGDDRGSCGDINTIRAALARPPAPQSEALDCLSMDDDGDVSIDFRAGWRNGSRSSAPKARRTRRQRS